jgi:inosine/xanthosine triphosphate pyrophosphatase family protein
MRLAFFSSNVGKADTIARWLSRTGIDFIILNKFDVEESNHDPALNARKKAIEGSLTTTMPVLATDEALIIENNTIVDVRRVAGSRASDEEVIAYYAKLLEEQEKKSFDAAMLTYMAIARGGVVLREDVLRQDLMLVLPPSESWLMGRPLSAFYYIPDLDKRFCDLTMSLGQ